MKSDSLLPGYANFMEEQEIMPENIDDQPSTENMEENADMAADATEAEMRLRNTGLEAENVLMSFAQLSMMHDYIEKYGVNKTFLYFFGDRFAAAGIDIPAEEDQATIGDPNSELSMACMASIGETLHKVWVFIKRVCKRIMDFLTSLIDAVFGRFRNVSNIIGKLRAKAMSLTTTPNPEMLKGYEVADIWGPMRVSSNFIGTAKRVQDLIDRVHDIYNNVARHSPVKSADKLERDMDELSSYAKRTGEAWISLKTISLTSITRQMITSALDYCGDCVNEANQLRRSVEVIKSDAKATLKIAEDYEKRASVWNQPEAKEYGNQVRHFITVMNKASTLCGKFVKNLEKLARLICLTISRILARWNSSSSRQSYAR